MTSAAETITAFVTARPGCAVRDIAKGTGYAVSRTKLVLRELTSAKILHRYEAPNPHGIGRSEFRYEIAAPMEKAPPTEAPAENTAGRSALDGAVDSIITTLADVLVARIAEGVRASVAARLPGVIEEIHSTYSPPKEKPKLRRIMVGGVLPKQHHEIEKEFDGVCDLVFAGVDDAPSVWKARATGAYAVILWTNFISHKHQEYITSAGIKPVLVTGGLTAVKDKIMEVCV